MWSVRFQPILLAMESITWLIELMRSAKKLRTLMRCLTRSVRAMPKTPSRRTVTHRTRKSRSSLFIRSWRSIFLPPFIKHPSHFNKILSASSGFPGNPVNLPRNIFHRSVDFLLVRAYTRRASGFRLPDRRYTLYPPICPSPQCRLSPAAYKSATCLRRPLAWMRGISPGSNQRPLLSSGGRS